MADISSSDEKVFQDLNITLSREIDQQIKKIVSEHKALYRSNLFEMLSHHFHWDVPNGNGGKKLRSTICLLSCLDISGDYKRALPMATAIEILHNFSLIHDDIVDKDRYRRGRSSIWNKWNVPYAINLGDGLYTLAYLALLENELEPEDCGALLRLLSKSAVKLCHGQQLDMEFEALPKISLEQYYEMVSHKTATLFQCASMGGAMVATNDVSVTSRYSEFGYNLGMYFQVIDDLKGLLGSEQDTGKTGRSDLSMNKKTLPAILRANNKLHNDEILKACLAIADQLWRNSKKALASCTENSSYLVDYIDKVHQLLTFKTSFSAKHESVVEYSQYFPVEPLQTVKGIKY